MSRIHRGRKQLQKRLWDYAERRNLHPRVEEPVDEPVETPTGG
jgi:hypothetical protein